VATLYYTWRKAPPPQLHREFMKAAGFLGSIYWIAGFMSILPEGTMWTDPEFGGPHAAPQKYVFSLFLMCGLIGTWLEH
jgi:hypothetical protein